MKKPSTILTPVLPKNTDIYLSRVVTLNHHLVEVRQTYWHPPPQVLGINSYDQWTTEESYIWPNTGVL
jgi:hypothetical protein